MRIWAKTVNNDKITRNYMYEQPLITANNFYNCVQEICNEMDVPTPVVIDINTQHFFRFNITKFPSREFVESVDFEYLELEFVG